MKPPWIDQGWLLVAGAVTDRGVHPPPTTSRPSLTPRACTPVPAEPAGEHFLSLSFSRFLCPTPGISAVSPSNWRRQRGLQGYRCYRPPAIRPSGPPTTASALPPPQPRPASFLRGPVARPSLSLAPLYSTYTFDSGEAPSGLSPTKCKNGT